METNNKYIELEEDGFLFARERGNDMVFVFKKIDDNEMKFLCFASLRGDKEEELIKQQTQAVKSFFQDKDNLSRDGYSLDDLLEIMKEKGIAV